MAISLFVSPVQSGLLEMRAIELLYYTNEEIDELSEKYDSNLLFNNKLIHFNGSDRIKLILRDQFCCFKTKAQQLRDIAVQRMNKEVDIV